MRSLIKVNLYRLKNDTLFKVMLILCVALNLLSVGMGVMIIEMAEQMEMINLMITGKSQFIASLSFASNMGLIIPIMLMIMASREYKYGLVRNKIIAGYSRVKIYFAGMISTLMIGLLVFIINSALSFICSSLVYGYGVTIDANEIGNIALIVVLGVVVTSVMYTIAYVCAIWLGSMAFIPYLVLVFGFSILATVLSIFESSSTVMFIQKLIPSYQVEVMLLSNDIQWGYIVVSSMVYIALFATFGYFIAKKKELK